jgi:hypothetical protein
VRKAQAVRLLGLLARIGAGPAARGAFLAARGAQLAKRMRGVPLRGDVPAYAHDLAVVVFLFVKNTADWYVAASKANDDVSGAVAVPRGASVG